MLSEVWSVAWFTVRMAVFATVLMLPIGVVLGWWLARSRSVGASFVETLVSLPLVMPPVAIGFMLIWLFGSYGPLGPVLEGFGIELVYTWKAVVVAMVIIGMPLLVRTARTGFEQRTLRYEQVASTLGAGPLRVFFTISLPLAYRSLLAGTVLAFSRALGEFGATFMIAGNIPGRTQTLSTAIYSHAESGRDMTAGGLLLISIAIAFLAILVSNWLTPRHTQ